MLNVRPQLRWKESEKESYNLRYFSAPDAAMDYFWCRYASVEIEAQWNI
jgi:hypothetical protein